MPKISPILRNLILIFLFFAIGRILLLQLCANGSWIIIGGVIVFYIICWINYQRNIRK